MHYTNECLRLSIQEYTEVYCIIIMLQGVIVGGIVRVGMTRVNNILLFFTAAKNFCAVISVIF